MAALLVVVMELNELGDRRVVKPITDGESQVVEPSSSPASTNRRTEFANFFPLFFLPFLDRGYGKLWEFIRDLLHNPKHCPEMIRWENVDEGVFRIVQSEKLAALWGSIKNNPRMTYEKLSRAMR